MRTDHRAAVTALGSLLPMEQSGPDMNATIWQSPEIIRNWAAEAERQEPKRAAQRRLMALLLPFGQQQAFTFLDLGAGTGAASRAVLAYHPRSTAILADFSAEMMRAGERDMQPFAGRYRYVEFDMLAGEWPGDDPSGARRGGDLDVRAPPARRTKAGPVHRDLRPPCPGWLVSQLRPGAGGRPRGGGRLAANQRSRRPRGRAAGGGTAHPRSRLAGRTTSATSSRSTSSSAICGRPGSRASTCTGSSSTTSSTADAAPWIRPAGASSPR